MNPELRPRFRAARPAPVAFPEYSLTLVRGRERTPEQEANRARRRMIRQDQRAERLTRAQRVALLRDEFPSGVSTRALLRVDRIRRRAAGRAEA